MGRRVTHEWWAENRPDRVPGTVVDPETGRTIRDLSSVGKPPEPVTNEEYEERQKSKRTGQDEARLAAIADAMGVPVTDPAMRGIKVTPEKPYDGLYVPPIEDEPATGASQPVKPGPSGPEEAEVAPRAGHRAKDAAFREKHGLPNHRKDRPSQSSGGRHLRHVRAMALKWSCSEEEADKRVGGAHPGCPWRAS
jgi:hypothetical protein